MAFESTPAGALLNDHVWIRLPRPKERLCGFSRTHIGELARSGIVRSVLIKHPGANRGVRLVHLPSLHEFIAKVELEQNGPPPYRGGRIAKWQLARERSCLAGLLRRLRIEAKLWGGSDARLGSFFSFFSFMGALAGVEMRGFVLEFLETQITVRFGAILSDAFLPFDYSRETRARRRLGRAAWLATNLNIQPARSPAAATASESSASRHANG